MVTVGSACTGYGGLDLALELVFGPIDLRWVCEFDKHPSTILSTRFPGVPNHGDVKLTNWNEVEPVDLFCAGYPCQPFSGAGHRKGKDDPRHLWPWLADAIGAVRPGLVVLENVAGHLTLGLADVLGDLAALGYDARWGVVRASDAGAPHSRERVFIAATDASGERHGRGQDSRGVGRMDGAHEESAPERERSRTKPVDRDAPAWGRYEPAIRRWERITGRRAPRPVESDRLSVRFVEWMMGLPAGWVTDVDIPRDAQRKALGNGVVPQQAALALRLLGVTSGEVAGTVR